MHNLEIVITLAIGMATTLITVISVFLWARSESRSDHKELESWVKGMFLSIQQEIKDFHGRLCAIEERNKEK